MKKKSINERIQEELQYTEELNKKIKKIEQKTYKKKEQIKSKKINFEYTKEIKYLKEQQRKIENELCIQLYDIANGKDDDLMQQFFFLMNFERDVSRDFYNTLDIVKKSILDLKNTDTPNQDNTKIHPLNKFKGINSLISTLHTFNQNLIVITKEDTDNLGINQIKDNDNEHNNDTESSNDIVDLIANTDCFNILSISDIDYLISQELSQAEQRSNILIPKEDNPITFYINQLSKTAIKDSLFNLPPISYSIQKSLEEKALITYGEEQGREMLKRITNSFELTIMKYNTDYNKLTSSLRKDIVTITKKDIPNRIKLKCGNMLFFIKHIDNKVSLNQRLSLDNTLQAEIPLYQSYEKFIEALYSFKAKQQTLISSYNNEINELKATSSKLLLEEINDTIAQRKKQIEQYEFDIRKQEMKTQHMKNMEIYDIKQKLKNEKQRIDEEMQRKANEKIEQEKKLRDERNKMLSENYIKQKRSKEEIERERLKREQELFMQKERDEINMKLPQIMQRHIRSTEQFITQQKKREIERSKKEYDQQRLNEIIENYKGRPKVEADSERLVAITKNLQNRYESIYNNKMDEGDKAKLFSNNGFTVENLMKDFRYKVSSALFEAGIVDKDYSHQMLKEINTIHCSNNPNNNNNASNI